MYSYVGDMLSYIGDVESYVGDLWSYVGGLQRCVRMCVGIHRGRAVIHMVIHRGHVVCKLDIHVKNGIIPAFCLFIQWLDPTCLHDEEAAFRGNSI
jgi:hypothetical protein